jgi:hypothetical protein
MRGQLRDMNASQRENPKAYQAVNGVDVTADWHAANNAQIYRETAAMFYAALLARPCESNTPMLADAAILHAEAFFAELDRRFAKP